MTAYSSVIQNFESGYYVDTCLRLLNNSEFWLYMPFILMIWNYSSRELHFLTWCLWIYQENISFILRFARLPLVPGQSALTQLWSPPEINGNFAIGFCWQNTEHREENSLEMSYSDVVCPPSGLWSTGGLFFRAEKVFCKLQDWNLVLFWIYRSVLDLNSTH